MLSKQFVLHAELVRESVKSFDAYPFTIPAINSLERLHFHPKVTYLVGENGTGKSTLLEAIAVTLGFNPEGGTKNFNFNTRVSHSSLTNHLRVARGVNKAKDGFFLRAESFFNLATEIENLDSEFSFSPPVINSYGYRPLHEQSHGESFMALLMKRLGGGGVYIFDEPESALSPQRQMAALSRIHDLVGLGSQFIIATHSPIILAYPDSIIYELSKTGIAQLSLAETETYQVMKAFINNTDGMLKRLLA